MSTLVAEARATDWRELLDDHELPRILRREARRNATRYVDEDELESYYWEAVCRIAQAYVRVGLPSSDVRRRWYAFLRVGLRMEATTAFVKIYGAVGSARCAAMVTAVHADAPLSSDDPTPLWDVLTSGGDDPAEIVIERLAAIDAWRSDGPAARPAADSGRRKAPSGPRAIQSSRRAIQVLVFADTHPGFGRRHLLEAFGWNSNATGVLLKRLTDAGYLERGYPNEYFRSDRPLDPPRESITRLAVRLAHELPDGVRPADVAAEAGVERRRAGDILRYAMSRGLIRRIAPSVYGPA